MHTEPAVMLVADMPQLRAASDAGVASRCILCCSIAAAHHRRAEVMTSSAVEWRGVRWWGSCVGLTAESERKWMGAMKLSLH